MSGPLYDVILVAHVVAAVVGFGALAASGVAASSGRRSPDPVGDESVRRFFRVGRDWPARAIFLVPVFGLILLLGGDRSSLHEVWPWIGLGLWTATAGVATARCWPAETAAQRAFAVLTATGDGAAGNVTEAGGAPETGTGPGAATSGAAAAGAAEVASPLSEFRAACRRMEAAAGVTSICFVAAVVVMIWQP